MPEWAWNVAAVLVGAVIAGGIGLLVHYLETNRIRKTLTVALHAELELLIIAVRNASEQNDPLVAVTGLREFRHATHVLVSNTDKIGFLGAENARSFIAAYSSVLLWINAAEDISQELRNAGDDEALIQNLRSDAASFLPRFAEWVKTAERLHEQIGRVC